MLLLGPVAGWMSCRLTSGTAAGEDHNPRFRVYLFRGGDQRKSSWATDTYDVTGADALEVIDWARNQAGEEPFAVALVVDEPRPKPDTAKRGLVWLVGHDANDRPRSETEQHFAERMHGMRRRSR